MSMTLDKLIQHHARYRGDKPAVIYDDQHLDWKTFNSKVNTLGNSLLNSGITKGDKVATVLPNSLELLTLYWAVTSIGAVVVPLSPLLQARGLVNLLRDADCTMVFLTPHSMKDLKPLLEELDAISSDRYVIVGNEEETEETPTFEQLTSESSSARLPSANLSPSDLFNIVYSSGTTGLPKGIEHTHLIRSQYGAHFAASYRMTPESVVLQTGSIVFNGAFITLMPAFFLGATYILHHAFDVEKMVNTIRDEKVTHAMMVPAQIIALLESPLCTIENLQSLEMILTLGAPLSQHDKKRISKILPGRLYELYGLTEGFVTILDKLDFDRKSGSVGCPPVGYEMRIVDEEGTDLPPNQTGEIVGRGPILMSGYYGKPELTAEAVRDGWLFSGDLGYMDEEGYLFLAGRKKEMILSGGINVFPMDIEGVAVEHPDILEVAVFGAPSERWGETPVAAVVRRDNSSIDSDTLKSWINERVEAKFQRVSDILFIDQFPRNVAGKILKNLLEEIYSEKQAQ